MNYKVPFYVTAALLLASLGLHLGGLELLPSPVAGEPAASASTAPEGGAPPSESDELRAAKLELRRLRAELTKCQDQSWDMAAELARGMLDPQQMLPSAHDTATGTMCAVSGWLLRKQWEHGAEVVGGILGKELGTEAWVETDLKQRLERVAGDDPLGQGQSDELERGYRGIWHRHGERMRQAAARGDWDDVAESARAFWQEEDELVRQVLGQGRAKAFGDNEAAVRTTLLALFATYGEEPWDESTLGP